MLKLQQQMDSLLDMYLQIPGNILFLVRHAQYIYSLGKLGLVAQLLACEHESINVYTACRTLMYMFPPLCVFELETKKIQPHWCEIYPRDFGARSHLHSRSVLLGAVGEEWNGHGARQWLGCNWPGI